MNLIFLDLDQMDQNSFLLLNFTYNYPFKKSHATDSTDARLNISLLGGYPYFKCNVLLWFP